MNERTIQSVKRAIDIMELYSPTNTELSVKEISERLQLSKSTVHGLIKTLEYRGYLEQNPSNQKYKLGLRLFQLGNVVGEGMEITRLSMPLITELVECVQETVHLVVLDGVDVVYVEKVEGPGALRMYSQVGKRAPFYCTGVGKAIFAYLGHQRIDEILSVSDLKAFTHYTLTDADQIRQELERIREQGYAIDDEEIELGLKCVAAPIFDHRGRPVASVSCSGPKLRLTDDKMVQMIREVKQTASRISQKLGYREV